MPPNTLPPARFIPEALKKHDDVEHNATTFGYEHGVDRLEHDDEPEVRAALRQVTHSSLVDLFKPKSRGESSDAAKDWAGLS